MYALNRSAEMELLGQNVYHLIQNVSRKEAALIPLYRGILDIVIDVLNDKSICVLSDKLDRHLRSTEMDWDMRLAVFDYLLPLIEKIIVRFNSLGVIEEVKYKLEVRNEKLSVGVDKIVIDFYATYYEMHAKLKQVAEKQDVIDNPTNEEMERILNSNDPF